MTESKIERSHYPIWMCLLVPMLAGGLGWGIRGQFGHESGAMVPGVLIGLTIAVLIVPSAGALRMARFAALAAVGFSFGGSMTYGQTLGLSQNVPIRETAYWWGMLGTTIKGGIWVALAGAFMGIGLSRRRYGVLETVALMLVMIVLWFVGVWALNCPLDAAGMKVPEIYFSDYWNMGKPGWKPRMELWGGLAFALVGLLAYLAAIRRDGRAVALSIIGLIVGGVGFTSGQMLQAYCAWHSPWPNAELARYVNAWKVMEVTFGLVAGLGMAIGCLLLYGRRDHGDSEDESVLSPATEIVLFLLMAMAMFAWNVRSYGSLDIVADVALTMGVIPIACIIGGRIWSYFGATLYVVIAIAARTCLSAADKGTLDSGTAADLLFALPLGIMFLTGLWAMYRGDRFITGRSTIGVVCVISIWVYTLLSNAQSVLRSNLFLATPKQIEAAGGVWGLITESLGSALVVESFFLIVAVTLTVLLVRALSIHDDTVV